MAFTPAELDYLRSQPLGRLATVGADGAVQVNPVGFRVAADGSFLIGGRSLATTRKYRNVAETGRAALVIDDLASRDPWTVRGIEVRGRAEATTVDEPPIRGGHRRDPPAPGLGLHLGRRTRGHGHDPPGHEGMNGQSPCNTDRMLPAGSVNQAIGGPSGPRAMPLSSWPKPS